MSRVLINRGGARLLPAVLGLLLVLAPAPARGDAATSAALGPAPTDAAQLGVRSGLGVVLVEAATGQVLVARGSDARRPVASTIKLVTALAAVEALPARSIVTIGDGVRGIEGASYGLRPGEVRTVEDLLVGLLLRSGNDAAVALAEAADGTQDAFLLRMERILAGLGITARPDSPSGLAEGDALSPDELAIVARAVLAEPRISGLVAMRAISFDDGSSVENRNLFLADIVGATGLKTGFTNAAGYSLVASASRDGRELIAVVLGAQDDRERRVVAARLIEHGFSGTRLLTLDHSVSLRTSSGPVLFTTNGSLLTLPVGDTSAVQWLPTLRPDSVLTTVPVRGGDAPAGAAPVVRLDGRRPDAGVGLGRALVDGVYGALRHHSLSGALR